MKTGQKQYSLIDRFTVVSILLLVFAMLIQNVLHSVKVSEERSVNHAVAEYAAVKSMYAEQRKIVPPGIASASDTGEVNFRKPTR